MISRAARFIRPVAVRSARRFGAGPGKPNEALHFHVSNTHKYLGTAYMTAMFLWMFYRAESDLAVVLVSVRLGAVRLG